MIRGRGIFNVVVGVLRGSLVDKDAAQPTDGSPFHFDGIGFFDFDTVIRLMVTPGASRLGSPIPFVNPRPSLSHTRPGIAADSVEKTASHLVSSIFRIRMALIGR